MPPTEAAEQSTRANMEEWTGKFAQLRREAYNYESLIILVTQLYNVARRDGMTEAAEVKSKNFTACPNLDCGSMICEALRSQKKAILTAKDKYESTQSNTTDN
jgi:hypothetical protein